MDKELTIRACTLLAQAYAFAKDGNEETAGRLLVQAAEDDGLDEVMDGVAQAANTMADENEEPENYEELPSGLDEDDDDEEYVAPAPDEDDEEDANADEPATVTASVRLPASVARLAGRALV